MVDRRPHPPDAPPRLTGAAQLVRALRNLGLLGAPLPRTEGAGMPLLRLGPATAQPVILLHGLGCTHRHWTAVAQRLAERHRVILWDARGHGGRTHLNDPPPSLHHLAQDVADVIAHERLQRVVLVGHSMGALTAMQYLHDHGSRALAAACFVDQSPRIVTDHDWALGLWGGCSAELLQAWIGAARADLPQLVLRELQARSERLGRWLSPDSWAGRRLANWLRSRELAPLLDLCESLVQADFRATLQRLNLPLRVVLGECSPHYARVPLADWYRRTVPGAEVEVYADAGHSPHVSAPRRFANELLAFIDAVG